MPSFKVLGASWALFRALAEHLSLERSPESFEELRDLVADEGVVLSAATAGNHGRAVARIAALLGVGAKIYVPMGTAPARIASIEAEGAIVHIVDGDYDDAVRTSAQVEGPDRLVISDGVSLPSAWNPKSWQVSTSSRLAG